MACRFVRKDDAAGRGARNQVGSPAKVISDEPTELPGEVGPLEDAELFDVGIGVAAAGELEVSTKERATLSEL